MAQPIVFELVGGPCDGGTVQALGHNPVDDNEADALALLRWAIERY